jgi:hypothetical protein
MTNFAELPGSEAWTRFAINCCAVVGGFIAGWLIGAIGGWAVDKWMFAKRSPAAAKKAINILCGLLLAILIGFLVFGEGGGRGWGFSGDGNKGEGASTNPDAGKTDPDTPPDKKTPPKIETPKTQDVKPGDSQVRITFLGGDAVQGDRFYLMDDEPVPKSFAELKAALIKRRDAATGTLTLVVLFPTDPRQRIDPNSINVAQVTAWAEAQGIGVFRPARK